MPNGGDLYLNTKNVTLDEKYIKPFDMIPGNYVKISITDTGTGMDHKTKQRIFEPFFTTKQMGTGTGLGLFTAYGIIENHNGYIHVYSENGKGSTFNIYLPAVPQKTGITSDQARDINQQSETVLLIDDEDIVIEVGKALLEKIGFHVLTAETGKQAVGIFEKKHKTIDIVILDMILPEMNGEEAFHKLKEIDPKVKVLLASGYSPRGQISKILKQGCKGFIQKPFDIYELVEKIRQTLNED